MINMLKQRINIEIDKANGACRGRQEVDMLSVTVQLEPGVR